MINSTQLTKAALMVNECQKEVSKFLGVEIILHFEIETSSSMTKTNVIKIVSQVSGIPVNGLMGRSQNQSICYARYVCFFLMRKYLGMTLNAIGKVFGKNHTTIMSGLDIIENEVKNRDLYDLLIQAEKTFLTELRK